MPLARIITRSETCGRQLTLDLIARGYAVEIVAPDSVPDNFADLVLRVEEESGKLVASVEAHNGGRTASLDFVRHLRAPLAEFEPRAPENVEVVYLSGEPVSLGSGLSAERVPLLAKVPPPGINVASAAALSASAAHPTSDSADAFPADPFSVDPVAVNSGRLLSVETISLDRTPVASVAGPVVSPRLASPQNRPSEWQWRAALAATSTVLLALVLALGARRFEKTTPAVPEADSEEIAVPSIDSNALTADFENTGTTSEDAVVGASTIDKTIIGTTIRAAAINDKTERSRQHEGLIARDTVVYLDASRQPARKAQVAKGVAANTVTYLSKPTPKPAK
jgi:hypothetical protein